MKTIKSWALSLILILIAVVPGYTQINSQTIRGTVLDKTSEKPLAGVTVRVADIATPIATITDESGHYILTGVPFGRHQFSYSSVNYQKATIPEVLVTSGKEVILDISLEQKIENLEAYTIVAPTTKKGAASNEFSAGSARSFNPDEVTRFAGGRNDPSKLVSNYAGVVVNSDARNDIVVRGNSPIGVLWRIGGIASPNPNHFATLGTTGGPVTALNTNVIKSSDFLTGAFPAEYGNAVAAVFDIKFRNGNSNKFEETFQLNLFSGLELTVEGPLSSQHNGASFLASYRYSFAQIAEAIGINIGTKAVPNYQDWAFNFTTAKGKFGRLSFFGMGGWSHIALIGSKLDSSDFYAQTDQDAYLKSNFSFFGIEHNIDLSRKSYLRTIISYAHTISDYDQYQYPHPVPPYQDRWLEYQSNNTTNSLRISSYFNEKLDNHFSYRAGMTTELLGLNTLIISKDGKPAEAPFDTVSHFNGAPWLVQGFAEFKYKPTEEFSIVGGLHSMYFTLNKQSDIEPRISFTYHLPANQSLSLSYGLHSQLQPMPVYFQTFNPTTKVSDSSNRQLGFTKAHHVILGYEKRFLPDWRIKAELYYQYLFDVPVHSYPSGFSMLNAGADFGFPPEVGLVNKGTGHNEGLELTIEKFFSKSTYVLLTTSLFDSKYKGSDGIERNTSFNYKTVLNLLGGKEWALDKSNTRVLTLDIRLSTIGGRYATPVNIPASVQAGYEILDTLHYNSVRLDGYFRLDTKFGIRINSHKRKISQTFYVDLQNVTNRKNIFLVQYNNAKATASPIYQIGFFPDIMYRIQF
jgi:hypothetical protein